MHIRSRTVLGAVLAAVVMTLTFALSAGPAAAVPPAGAMVPKASQCIYNWDGRLECFWVGPSDYRSARPPGPLWHAWAPSSGAPVDFRTTESLGGYLTHDISVGRNADGRLEVFGRALGNDLAHRWQAVRGGRWNDRWHSLGGTLSSGPYVHYLSGGRIAVDVYGPDGGWHRKYQQQPSCCWIAGWV